MTNLKSRAVYLVLLVVQLTGALFIILDGLPEFRHLIIHPGEQLPFERSDNLARPVIIIAMQVAYWYRLRRVPLPPSALESDPESPVSVSWASCLYFRWLAVRCRVLQTFAGDQSRRRSLAHVPPWAATRGVVVRAILRTLDSSDWGVRLEAANRTDGCRPSAS